MGLAVTPTLFVETDTPLLFPHVHVESAELAAQYIKDGSTVQVPSPQVAFDTLILLGVSTDDAGLRIRIALFGPTAVSVVDPTAPVPLAPGADDR